MGPTMLFDSENPDHYGLPSTDMGDGGLNLNGLGIVLMEEDGRSAAFEDEEIDA